MQIIITKMKMIKSKYITIAFIATAMVGTVGCIKDFVNPNAATEEQVFSSAKGLTGAAVGLQRVYTAGRGSSLFNMVVANGLITRELILLNPGNIPELELVTGAGAVTGTNNILAGLWSTNNKIIADADKIIGFSQNLADKNYASGLIGYSTVLKALAIGNLSLYWEKVPASIGNNVLFVDRKDGFKRAIAAIDNALATINSNAISAPFIANIPAGIDIVNSLHALKARYSLFSDQYAQAIASVNNVDLTKRSTFNFDALNLNSVFETATATNNVVQPVDSTLGLPPSLAPNFSDLRIPFYTTINTSIAPRYRIGGFGATATSSWPVYLPGEMILIKAEAFARQSDLPNALIELNKIITKQPAQDPFGVGAGLSAVSGLTMAQVLDEIYRHRSIELFMSGLRLEDMRRFNRPTSERRRNFFPYPFIERDNNTNTPPDPAF